LWKQALSDYEAALQLAPGDNDALFGRALIHLQMRRFDEVLAGTKTLTVNREHLPLRLLRALAYQHKSRWNEAVAEYDHVLSKATYGVMVAALRELARNQLAVEFPKFGKGGNINEKSPPLPQAGEIRLQGTVKSVDKAQNSLVIEATQFTLPNGKTSRLAPAKQKTIIWQVQTKVFPFAGFERSGTIDEIKAGATAWIIGADKGGGSALPARWLGANQNLPDTPKQTETDAEPTLSAKAIGRPQFTKSDGKTWTAGTAVIARLDDGGTTLLSAQHLLGPDGGLEKEIPASEIKAVLLHDFQNKHIPGVASKALPLKAVPEKSTKDVSADFVAFRFAADESETAGQELAALPLAAENPKVNEPLWLAGRAVNETRAGNKGLLLYPARAVLVEEGRLVIQLKDTLPLRAFSGAPVVNARGEIVGLLLSSNELFNMSFFVCNPVSALRARLKTP
jgi:hypothetical protein